MVIRPAIVSVISSSSPVSLKIEALSLEKFDGLLKNCGRNSSPSRKRSDVLRESNLGRIGGEAFVDIGSATDAEPPSVALTSMVFNQKKRTLKLKSKLLIMSIVPSNPE